MEPSRCTKKSISASRSVLPPGGRHRRYTWATRFRRYPGKGKSTPSVLMVAASVPVPPVTEVFGEVAGGADAGTEEAGAWAGTGAAAGLPVGLVAGAEGAGAGAGAGARVGAWVTAFGVVLDAGGGGGGGGAGAGAGAAGWTSPGVGCSEATSARGAAISWTRYAGRARACVGCRPRATNDTTSAPCSTSEPATPAPRPMDPAARSDHGFTGPLRAPSPGRHSRRRRCGSRRGRGRRRRKARRGRRADRCRWAAGARPARESRRGTRRS